MKILIIEDEVDARQLLTTYFESKGHQVTSARDGVEALEKFHAAPPEIILLDIRIPRLDGWSVLQAIRTQSQVPVVMLTALDSPEDAVKGLTLGADYYLRKPFQFSELEACINAVLRRMQERANSKRLELKAGCCWIDEHAKTVTLNGQVLTLSPKEYELFKLLAINPRRIVSIQEILAHLWPISTRADASDVKQYVYLLRGKIKAVPKCPPCIETIKGFGYQLQCDQCELKSNVDKTGDITG